MGFDKLKAGGKELFIDVFLEFNKDEVIAKLKKVLAPLTVDNLRQLVTEGQAPPIHEAVLESLKGYDDYIGRLQPEELFEWLNKARPDLAKTLMSLGDSGAEYMVKLKAFFVGSIKAPTEPPAATEPAQSKPQMVRLHCEAGGKDMDHTNTLAKEITVCPFCGVGVEEQAKE